MTDENNTSHVDAEDCAFQLPSRIKNASLVPIAASFSESVETIEFLKIIPQVLMSHAYAEAAGFSFFKSLTKTDDIRVRPGIVGERAGFEDWFGQVRARVEAVAATDEAQKKFRDHLWETANRQINSLVRDKKVAGALRSINLARVVLAWTAFECVAGDGWETALNESAIGLGHQAFMHLSTSGVDEGISARNVPVGLLAKHGFDLRKKLGTVLKAKFDFTSVAGIRDAHKAAFGDREALTRTLGDPKLSRLEATRHLIVHRSGVVDEEYIRRTNSTLSIGQALPLEEGEIADMVEATILAGCGLLAFVDECLTVALSNQP